MEKKQVLIQFGEGTSLLHLLTETKLPPHQVVNMEKTSQQLTWLLKEHVITPAEWQTIVKRLGKRIQAQINYFHQ